MSESEKEEEMTLPEPDLERDLSVEEREIVARLYFFLEAEYKHLRSLNPNGDLTPLMDIRKRTAEACGVTAARVTECVKEFHERLRVEMIYSPPPTKSKK